MSLKWIEFSPCVRSESDWAARLHLLEAQRFHPRGKCASNLRSTYLCTSICECSPQNGCLAKQSQLLPLAARFSSAVYQSAECWLLLARGQGFGRLVKRRATVLQYFGARVRLDWVSCCLASADAEKSGIGKQYKNATTTATTHDSSKMRASSQHSQCSSTGADQRLVHKRAAVGRQLHVLLNSHIACWNS